MAFKLAREEIQLINAFDEISKVNAKACFVDEQAVVFLVEETDIGRAIGKNGLNIKKFQGRINKHIEIMPFSNQPEELAKKVLKMIGVKVGTAEIKEEDGRKVLFLELESPEGRQKVLRNKPRFKRLKAILKKNFEVENIKLR